MGTGIRRVVFVRMRHQVVECSRVNHYVFSVEGAREVEPHSIVVKLKQTIYMTLD